MTQCKFDPICCPSIGPPDTLRVAKNYKALCTLLPSILGRQPNSNLTQMTDKRNSPYIDGSRAGNSQ